MLKDKLGRKPVLPNMDKSIG